MSIEIRGRFRAHRRGYGFVTPVADDGLTPVTCQLEAAEGSATVERVFVPPRLVRSLISDDLVRAKVSQDAQGATAHQVTALERPRRILPGTIRRRRGALVLEATPELTPARIPISASMEETIRRNVDEVAVVLVDAPGTDQPTAQALVAGPFAADSADAVRAETVAAVLGRAAPALISGGASSAGLDPAEAETTHLRLVGQLAGGRRGAAAGLDRAGPVPGSEIHPVDRSQQPCLTIDAASARDLDDAIAASWDGAADSPVVVSVHIADAAGSVGMGSAADRYARTVAATTYLASGASAPMLDPALSEQELSLRADVDRRVLTVRYGVAPDGALIDPQLELATVRSRARLTYATVEQWLRGDHANLRRLAGDGAGEAETVLESAIEAARRLGIHRAGRTSLEELFASAELVPSVVDGELTAVPAEPHAQAYQLIEQLMVAANIAVGRWLVERNVPALYRVHEGIDAQRLARVRTAAALTGAVVPALGGDAAPEQPSAAGPDGHRAVAATDAVDTEQVIAELLGEVVRFEQEGRDADRDLLVSAATGASARATYESDPASHRGLAAAAYTHSTSPLRRYADLVVHRQVRATLAGQPPPYAAEDLRALAGWLDARSGALARLEARERTELWALLLDRGWLAGPEPATVTAISRAGLTVRLPRLGLTGFVTAEDALGLPGDERATLTATDRGLATTSGPWRVGSRVHVHYAGRDDRGRPSWRLDARDRPERVPGGRSGTTRDDADGQ